MFDEGKKQAMIPYIDHCLILAKKEREIKRLKIAVVSLFATTIFATIL